MINKLTMTNFQAHENTTIEFQPGVNVIVGPSDRGKSSIIRALQLIFFNRPGGDAFIRHGAKQCHVEVDLAGGNTISRTRSSVKNEYAVNGAVLKAPGREVPKEVSDVYPIQEINFQGQHDSPFMLSESAGEVGRMLNKMVDLTSIDRSLSYLNGKKRDLSQKIESVRDNIKESEAERVRYAPVTEMQKDMITIKEIGGRLNIIASTEEKADSCIESCCKLTAELKKMPDPNEVARFMSTIETTLTAWKGADQHADELHTQIRTITGDETDIAELKVIEDSTRERIKELMGDQCPLCGHPTEK
jgi:exonuclease SbcC